MEIWKDVPGYEGKYVLSNLGKVKSLVNNQGGSRNKILKDYKDTNGYKYVALCLKGIRKNYSVHKLLAKLFIDPYYDDSCLVVNHINHKRDDNRLENLEIVTIRENGNQKHIPSTSKYVGVSFNKENLKWRAVIYFDKKSKHLGYFNTEEEASFYYESALKCVQENCIQYILVKEAIYASKYKGVSKYKNSEKWRAAIKIKGKTKHLGTFKTEQEAAEACQNAKQQLTT